MARSLTLFVARFNGVVVATAAAISYGQANLLLGNAKVWSNELEDYGPVDGKARVEYQEGLPEYYVVVSSPREVEGPGLKNAVTNLLAAGYTSSNIRLAFGFVAEDKVLTDLTGKFQVVKNKLAFRRDHPVPPSTEDPYEAPATYGLGYMQGRGAA